MFPATVWLLVLITSSRAGIPPELLSTMAAGNAVRLAPPDGNSPQAAVFGRPASDSDVAPPVPQQGVQGGAQGAVAASAPITQGQWWPAGSPGQWQPRPAGIPEPPPALPPTQEILQAAASLRGAEQSIPPPGVGPEAGRSAVVGAVAKVRSFHGGGCKTYPPVPAFVPGLPLVPPPTAPPAEFAQNLQLSPRAPSEASSGVPSSWLWADIPNDQRGHLCASAMTSSPPLHPPRLEERNIFGCPVRRTDDASDAESIARRVAAADIDMGASSVSGFSHVHPHDGEALAACFYEARAAAPKAAFLPQREQHLHPPRSKAGAHRARWTPEGQVAVRAPPL
jgi:hypothetical protein